MTKYAANGRSFTFIAYKIVAPRDDEARSLFPILYVHEQTYNTYGGDDC
jgi:hypothetical protein